MPKRSVLARFHWGGGRAISIMLLSASLMEGGRRKPIQLFRWPSDSFSAFNLGVSPKPIEVGAGGFFVCTRRLPLNVELAPSNTASTVRGLFRGRAYRSQIFPLAQTALAWASTCFLWRPCTALHVARFLFSPGFCNSRIAKASRQFGTPLHNTFFLKPVIAFFILLRPPGLGMTGGSVHALHTGRPACLVLFPNAPVRLSNQAQPRLERRTRTGRRCLLLDTAQAFDVRTDPR